MRNLAFWIVALFILGTNELFCQSLSGVWQGTLQSSENREQRLVVKIDAMAGPANLTAMLYAIDKPGTPIPASAVVVRGSSVKLSFPGMIATYEGILARDGNSITGTWSQGAPVPLKLTRATPETAWAIPAPPDAPKPMAQESNPSFEVATVKPSAPDQRGRSIHVQGRRFSTTETTLGYLIAWAYGLHARQIAGAPEWVDREKYDLMGEAENDGQPNERQWKGMVQKLLADRFLLVFHREQREIPVYVLMAEKTGQKLTKSSGNPDRLAGMGFRGRPGAFFAHDANMADFASFMQIAMVDRPVIDKTGIAGRFDFVLDWNPDDFELARLGAERSAAMEAAPNPDLFTAIRQQLGLRLEGTKTPAEVFVIDRAERPSAN